jgi:hypothetical protein
MAFQTGTQVRPELGRADVSGFARGGAAIGAGILQGIQNYQQQKQITASALSDLEGRMAADPLVLQAMQQAGENNPKLAKSLKNLAEGNFNQSDVLSLDGFASAYQKQKLVSLQSELAEAKVSAAKQSQKIEAINFNAREQAIAMNTRPDGSVDVAGLGSTYTQLGGRDEGDIKLFGDMAEQAKTGRDPVIKTLNVDGFQVLLVDGKFMQARGAGGDEADPAQVKVMENKTQQYNKARELYKQGDVAGSKAILVGIGVKDMFGRPAEPEEEFSDVTFEGFPTPLDLNKLDPEQIDKFRSEYLTPKP